jgi:hypothetical protein
MCLEPNYCGEWLAPIGQIFWLSVLAPIVADKCTLATVTATITLL